MKRKCAVPNEAHSAQLKTWSTREAPISGKRQLSYLVTNALGDPRLLLALGGHWRACGSFLADEPGERGSPPVRAVIF